MWMDFFVDELFIFVFKKVIPQIFRFLDQLLEFEWVSFFVLVG